MCPPSTTACQVDVCAEALKACTPGAVPDGTSCSTMDICLSGQTCTAGMCGGGVPANQGMPCTGTGGPCFSNYQCNNGTCAGTPITACVNGDGCCPPGCTAANDIDCSCSVNLALTATGSVSFGGSVPPFTPAELNNGIGRSQCSNRFSWISNSSNPSGAWFELDWTSPVTIASLYVESPNANGTDCVANIAPGRNVASADVQTWNGTTWVTAISFAGKSGDIQVDLPSPVITTKLRLYNVTAGLGNGNSLIYEWHVFGAPTCVPPPD
jgi:hypothetical protein